MVNLNAHEQLIQPPLASLTEANPDSYLAAFSSPQELTAANIEPIDRNACGVIIVSKFADITNAGALAIKVGKIHQLLLKKTGSYESSYFFRYLVTRTEDEAERVKQSLCSLIVVHKLGE